MEFRLVKISQTWHNWCAYHRGETRIRWKINHQVSTSTIFHLSCISDRYKSYYVMLKCLIVLWTSTIVHHEINLLLEFQILGIVVRASPSKICSAHATFKVCQTVRFLILVKGNLTWLTWHPQQEYWWTIDWPQNRFVALSSTSVQQMV